MLNIVIFGAPGSGKGTQSELIIKDFGLKHISTGELLRKEIKKETPEGLIAKKCIDKGHLVPDELINKMLIKELDSEQNEKGVILDGYPRTIPQAESLKKMLNERGTDVSILLDLQVEEEVLVDRLLKRGQYSGRSDDNLDIIKERLNVYHAKTEPLLEFYKKENKYQAIKGFEGIEAIYSHIKEIISKEIVSNVI